MMQLNDDNFVMYCIKHYDSPDCSGLAEFYDDLKRIKYIKRLFIKYRESGELRERLILNHLVVLNNLFGVESASKILMFKIDKKHWDILRTFFLYLNMDTEAVEDTPFDQTIVDALRKI